MSNQVRKKENFSVPSLQWRTHFCRCKPKDRGNLHGNDSLIMHLLQQFSISIIQQFSFSFVICTGWNSHPEKPLTITDRCVQYVLLGKGVTCQVFHYHSCVQCTSHRHQHKCYLIVQIQRCWVVQYNTVTRQLSTIPLCNERFGRFLQTRDNEVFNITNPRYNDIPSPLALP